MEVKGFVTCMHTMTGVVIDWITNEDGTESPEVHTDPRQAAREIIEQRIDFLRSRLDNIDAIDDDDAAACLEEANAEAGDDLELWIEPVTIRGSGPDATIQLECWSEPELLRDFHRANGRNDVLRWEPHAAP